MLFRSDRFMDDVLVHSRLHRSLAVQFLANCYYAMLVSVERNASGLFERLVDVGAGSEGDGALSDPILVAD